jgi:orotidine-5'-phosphate decarboxylase
MSFRAKLAQAAAANRSLLCVGLDPDPERIDGRDIASFLRDIVAATSDLVCAYKPNLAFYEQLGEGGYALLREVLQAIPSDIPVIGDAKRGDIGHTMEAYARAIFDDLGFDAVTVQPYLGHDSVAPFLKRGDKGVFIVCRTSNPGAAEFQDVLVEDAGATRPLYEVVALHARSWDEHGNVGLVAGATYPGELKRLRSLCPEMPFLVPGLGAQAGELEASVRAGLDAEGGGMVINASRSVLYASTGSDFGEAARREAESLRRAIEAQRAAAAGSRA